MLKGSIIERGVAQSFSWKEKRILLIDNYTSIVNNKLILNSDVIFTGVSRAAVFCMGRSENG